MSTNAGINGRADRRNHGNDDTLHQVSERLLAVAVDDSLEPTALTHSAQSDSRDPRETDSDADSDFGPSAARDASWSAREGYDDDDDELQPNSPEPRPPPPPRPAAPVPPSPSPSPSLHQRTLIASNQQSRSNSPDTNEPSQEPTTSAPAIPTVAEPARDTPSPMPRKRTPADFKFGKTLGEGSYSTVVVGTEIATGRRFAIKILDKRHIIKEKKTKYVNIEKQTLNRLRHPSVLSLHYTFQDNRSLYFVLDLAQNGELLTWIRKLGSFDVSCTRFYAAETVNAIAYLHSKGVIHRDLKPENILLDERMHIKLADFGTAKLFDPSGDPEGERSSSFVGTAEYVSPELLTNKAATRSCDWWALGCIIYQLLAGRPPFKAANEYLTFQKIVKLEYGFPDGFPADAQDLVQRLLVVDPDSRLGSGPAGIEELHAHPFFNSINWSEILYQTPPRLLPYLPPTANHNASELRSGSGMMVRRQGSYCTTTSQSDREMLPSVNDTEDDDYDDEGDDHIAWAPNAERDTFEEENSKNRREKEETDNEKVSDQVEDNQVSEDSVEHSAETHTKNTVSQFEGDTPHENITLKSDQEIPEKEPRSTEPVKTELLPSHEHSVGHSAVTSNRNKQGKETSRSNNPLENPLIAKILSPDERVIHAGIVYKRRGLFSKRRLLVLTDRPRLVYGDDVRGRRKGVISCSERLSPEFKDSRHFFVHAPTKTYYFEDVSGNARNWVTEIERTLSEHYD